MKNLSEEIFAAICSNSYLQGFVFHSPKYYDPTEKEAGDVVLWVRSHLIVFEILWRNTSSSGSTRQFIKRIGEKRDQLVNDFDAFSRQPTIKMKNVAGEDMEYISDYFEEGGFCGIVIVDTNTALEPLHFETLRKSLDQQFPIAILTKRDFLDILEEVDTVADLRYYLMDRTKFMKQVLDKSAAVFLNLNKSIERNLVAFYKMHNNQFPVDKWQQESAYSYWDQYQVNFTQRLNARRNEHEQTFILDEITSLLRSNNSEGNQTLLHSWELAVLPRRARVKIASKVEAALNSMQEGRASRHFAFLNPVTLCWNLFYFQYGGSIESFRPKAEELTKLKIQLEIAERKFCYSVLCFAFRKSMIHTHSTFDNVILLVEDADKQSAISQEDYSKAKEYFGGPTDAVQIVEFPT